MGVRMRLRISVIFYSRAVHFGRPLIEKAYAKLFGDYKAIGYGQAPCAIEDMTG
jgi:hypothetical protein